MKQSNGITLLSRIDTNMKVQNTTFDDNITRRHNGTK